MQTRGQLLKLRHILSHMEHKHTLMMRTFPFSVIA
jgi:hypothetical protein